MPLLVEAGLRVVTVDQRGMGASSATWPEYGSTPLALDLIALIRHLDAGPAIIYGTSNGAAAGVGCKHLKNHPPGHRPSYPFRRTSTNEQLQVYRGRLLGTW